MSFRSKLPMQLNALLLLGIALLAWLKLRTWHGTAQLLGAGVCLGYLLWMVWEARISLRDAGQRSVRSDRWTMEIYAASQGFVVLSALMLASPLPEALVPWMPLGALLFGLGVVLRSWSVRELGRFYSHRVAVTESHTIIRTGPYRWLRHPAYAGMIVAHLGFVLVFFHWLSLAVLAGALVPSVLMRIRVEEAALAVVGGYREFCARRARLVPFVW